MAKKITFTQQVQYENEGRKMGQVFKRGQVETLRDDLADRWLRRGVAVEGAVKLDPEPVAPKTETPPKRVDGADKVQIPEDYAKQSVQALVGLAAQLYSGAVKSRPEAIAVIEAELKLRADAAAASKTTA